MPFTNFDSRHFTATEKTTIINAIVTAENALQSKAAVLTAEERQQYGSVNEQNKLIINKVKDFRDSQPGASCPDVDWTEFANDYDTRSFLQVTIQRLQSMIDGLSNAKLLHDWDNYQAALIDYKYSKFKFDAGVAGHQTKIAELGQFFAGRPVGSTQNPETNGTES